MSSMAGAVERVPAAVDSISVRRQLVMTIGLALVVLMPVLALVLLARRLSGAFVQPPSGMAMVAVALALEVVALLIRRLVLSTKYLVLSTQSLIPFGAISATAITILAAFTLAGTHVVGIIFAWLVLIAGEAVQTWFYLLPDLRRVGNARPASALVSSPSSEAEEPEIHAGLVQQLTRVREAGHESLHALVRAEIPADDRLAVLHLSFCPPLSESPQLTAHAMDAENAEVRVTLAETFGARIEVRLPREDATPRSVLIEVLGTVTARPDA